MFEDCTCANYFEQFVHVVTHKSAPLIREIGTIILVGLGCFSKKSLIFCF